MSLIGERKEEKNMEGCGRSDSWSNDKAGPSLKKED